MSSSSGWGRVEAALIAPVSKIARSHLHATGVPLRARNRKRATAGHSLA